MTPRRLARLKKLMGRLNVVAVVQAVAWFANPRRRLKAKLPSVKSQWSLLSNVTWPSCTGKKKIEQN